MTFKQSTYNKYAHLAMLSCYVGMGLCEQVTYVDGAALKKEWGSWSAVIEEVFVKYESGVKCYGKRVVRRKR